jgi:hypothetical protein
MGRRRHPYCYDYHKAPSIKQTCGLNVFREYNGQPQKYWSVEVQWARRLTRRETRRFTRYLSAEMNLDAIKIYPTGITSDHWPHEWADDWTNMHLAHALKRLGVACCVRAAPAGRDCSGRGVCPAVCDDATCCASPRCILGGCGSCDPVFTEADWQHLDFKATNGPRVAMSGTRQPATAHAAR